ncbi:MAG: ATP-dependent DNA ligase [Podila humilis]|nr:MAG: ATP-dependent DNA ligase [Podila humilis]
MVSSTAVKERTKEAQETVKEKVKEFKEVNEVKEVKETKEKTKAVVAEDDVVEPSSVSEDKEIEEAEKEDEEQEKEAVEIKQAAAKWADMFSKSEGVESASWKKGEPVPYAALCQTFELIEDTTKRLQILDYLVKFLIQVIKLSPESLLTVIYLSINKLCPEYEGLELGIGESLLMKAIAESTGREMKKIKESYAEIGDLGVVAMNSRSNQPTMFKPKALTIPHVFKTLKDIASLSGNSSQKQKVDKIKVLLVSCRNKEAKYLMRSLEGKLRIGLAERTVVVALAQAIVLSRPDIKKLSKEKLQHELEEAATVVKSVYSELPCYDMIVPALLSGDIEGLQKACKLTPGIPLKPMLAHPTKALTDILDRFENIAFTCEYKYDGERAQIHKLEQGSMMIYSRNSENMSAKYPDVMERLHKFAKSDTKSFVLDCEAVAWDREQKCILPFQVLSTRKRKDVKEEDIKVQVCIFAFDLLYLNGESLLREPLAKRRQLLQEHFLEVDGEFAFAKSMNSTQIEDIQTFLDQSVADNCEGLMVKTMDGAEASYEPSKRSRNWLKVKKDYLAGVGDSIDLVVIGAYIGRGKRTGVYGGYLLACYDPEREEYQSICKIGTGFSEQDLEVHHKELKEHVIPEPKSYYVLGEGNKPDVWFAPVRVWEIKCADLSVSPVYKAAVGIVDSTKGISLRFPRFIRIRDDKSPENATSSEQIAEMYNDQKLNTVKNDTSMGVDMDFDY